MTRYLIANLLGLLLLFGAAVGLLVVASLVHPYAGVTVALAYAGGIGFVLATYAPPTVVPETWSNR